MRDRRKEMNCYLYNQLLGQVHPSYRGSKMFASSTLQDTFVVSSKKRRVKQECTDFPEIWEPPQSYMCQKGDLKHVPYCKPKILGANVENLVATETRFSWFVHPWLGDILRRNWISSRLSYSRLHVNSSPSWLVLGICCRRGSDLRGPMVCSKLRYQIYV